MLVTSQKMSPEWPKYNEGMLLTATRDELLSDLRVRELFSVRIVDKNGISYNCQSSNIVNDVLETIGASSPCSPHLFD